ncbi:hypothetical protein GGR52DRAFT_592520 [Hypoxylon sp. FL1284]|nr:hypothetical protein GGR52DRAFT_592520 [Hypoxylon sp. FL1284]
MVADIAIVGLSFKGPQEAEDEGGLWNILESGRNVMTEWPKDRANLAPFYDAEQTNSNRIPGRGAHFMKQDLACFDAAFFSVTAKEAAIMDPQQRLTLEASYRAFENAGMSLERLKGTRTGVFAASTASDYHQMFAKDPEAVRATISGTSSSLLANRVSWYFDLLGPSVHVDTACSSSLTALDMACQSIRSGDASMALVAGINLILEPETSVALANGRFLSPDSVCYSFDHRANGFSRGEGVVALVVKPVSDAVRDGDMIRAVIRSTGSNQDGHTPIMTQPSPDSQEQLIRHVYEKAGLDFESTRYFEAHGTGTTVGDPAEMKAIGRVFRPYRSAKEPLYVGSIKSNIGHLEGGSGLAGVLKAMLTVEKGIIPPNALFEKMNPAIDADFYRTSVPTECLAWPAEGLRRVSVNSFGFGGSNGHVVMDDAFHYLETRGLKGNHCTVSRPRLVKSLPVSNGKLSDTGSHTDSARFINGDHHIHAAENGIRRADEVANVKAKREITKAEAWKTNGHTNGAISSSQQSSLLLVWSANDEKTLHEVVNSYETYCQRGVAQTHPPLDQLAFTLAARRSVMLWRTYAVVRSGYLAGSPPDTVDRMLSAAKLTRASADANLAFVFTGQGAQYVTMGLELIRYPVFAETLQRIQDVLWGTGCPWSLIEELGRADRIDSPEYSQPLCTALQIALVELLKSFSVVPGAVLGHSSGEIAAAYATGALSLASACKVAYHRGQLAGELKRTAGYPCAMLSANLSEHQIRDYVASIGSPWLAEQIHVACVNSHLNVTLSGPEDAIDLVKQRLDGDGIFAQKIKTGVPYHSPLMRSVATEYERRIGSLEAGDPENLAATPMVSSVSAQLVSSPSLLRTARYWVDNMVSPVRFSDALLSLTQAPPKLGAGPVTHLVEVGSHPALRRPVQDTLRQMRSKISQKIRYDHVLHRSKPSHEATLEFVGRLFCDGYPVSVTAVNQQPDGKTALPFRVDCPEYPFNRSRRYWIESRLSRDYRLRGDAPVDSLGFRSHDWNPLEPSWRRFISVENTPWTKDHAITKKVLYPGTGMIVMALEAVKQLCPENREIAGYLFKEAQFLNPLLVGEALEDATETIVKLRRVQNPYEKESVWSDVKIMTQSKDRWTECFQALIQIQYKVDDAKTQVDGGLERRLRDEAIQANLDRASKSCTRPLDSEAFYGSCDKAGMVYGETFRLLRDIRWDGKGVAVGKADVTAAAHRSPSLAHPAVLDCALQLLLVLATKGLAGSHPAVVPARLRNMWVAASGWQPPATTHVQYIAEGTASSGSSGWRGISTRIHVVAADGIPLSVIEQLEASPVSGKEDVEEAYERNLLYGIDWKPQLGLMSPRDLRQVCCDNAPIRDATEMTLVHRGLEQVLNEVMRRTLNELSVADEESIPDAMQKQLRWMKQHVAGAVTCSSDAEKLSHRPLESMLREAEETYPPCAISAAVSRNLKPILLGQTDALSVVFEGGLAERFYRDMFDLVCRDQFRSFLELMAHENPTMRILEVGAGTGSMTAHLLSGLGEVEKRSGGNAFSEYVYTDISPSFQEGALARFKNFESRLTFKTFDLDRKPADQGLEEGYFDVVVAGSVLHATRDLKKVLGNLRAVLKPGGRLMCLEIVKPESVLINFSFGVLPGWWASTDAYRSTHPTLTEEHWDQVLRASGFSGNDLVLRDYDDGAECHALSFLISTRRPASAGDLSTKGPSTNGLSTAAGVDAPPSGRLLLIVQDNPDAGAIDLAESIQRRTKQRKATMVPLSASRDAEFAEDDVVISLLEVGGTFLASMSPLKYQALKGLVDRVHKLLWITSASPKEELYPYYELAPGLLRTLRAENLSKQFVFLAIETRSVQERPVAYVESVAKVLSTAFDSPSEEVEYRIRDGLIVTARLFQEMALNDTLISYSSPRVREQSWNSGRPVKLSFRTPGFLDTLEFVEDADTAESLGPHEVEIEPRSWGLNFRDVLVALGRMPDLDLGYDYSGVVTRVGSLCDAAKIRPGDRVCGGSLGCIRTSLRVPAAHIAKIPDSLSFEAAASLVVPGTTAYYSLVEVARLRKGEKVLIHSAAGATGQMAVRVAHMVGAEVFATVGFDEKKRLLVDELGVAADHIFYSRDTSFTQGVRRVTAGYGVDVVLNSLSGDGLRASWECLAPYGRFIEIGKADIGANSGLPMANFARNITFSAVDLHYVGLHDPELSDRLLGKALALAASGRLRPPTPLNTYATSEIEQAFRHLQSGKSVGRVLLNAGPDDVVPKRLLERSTWTLDPDATYVIAGASGGIGRAISAWMADKGARNLLLLSRSGSTSAAAAETVAELRRRGVRVAAPPCDVSSEASLSAALRDHRSSMPPVKGCIDSAMVINDAVFANMTHDQWDVTMRSKAHTAWNLDKLLPKSLDFFVLLASISGIYGGLLQSNYAAGCTFQDSLARRRVARGQKAISFDLGWMRNVGIVSETATYSQTRQEAADMNPIEDKELLALLDIYCRPDRPVELPSRSQLVIGPITIAECAARNMPVPATVSRPMFSPFSIPLNNPHGTAPAADGVLDFAAMFRDASVFDDRADVVVRGLVTKLARACSLAPDDVEPSKQLSDYGVDSLMAVELRNWISKDFAANVAAFDIVGGGVSIASIGALVVEKSQIPVKGSDAYAD